MSEFWKSTERYWCKHCQVYIRDTKLERANHEATARHQGNLKRSLRDLHRGHEREQREKDRAKQEIERLNGVVPGNTSSSNAAPTRTAPIPAGSHQTRPATVAQLQKQREQLAAMGIEMPSELRPEMAMAGQWTVTSTKIIEAPTKSEDGDDPTKVEGRANGVRKREVTEEEKEEEDAMRGLFKKPKKWGRDTKTMPADEDKELDALLNGALLVKKEPIDANIVKKEEEDINENAADEVQNAPRDERVAVMPSAKDSDDVAPKDEAPTDEDATPSVVFKKRKPKVLRTK
ncbi:hypothetical protein VHEMI00360 [[Torrubiella] hemipterigena]|uniref:U1-type domain-containing protein n=1 Tax=[Torrubiella] hemipterigena TaxID=1531966 RepID=A0A0A1T1S5_9HYPO|nr:hypothetical protein VHEMI00360 [[Torrubiella] hemipterigena]